MLWGKASPFRRTDKRQDVAQVPHTEFTLSGLPGFFASLRMTSEGDLRHFKAVTNLEKPQDLKDESCATLCRKGRAFPNCRAAKPLKTEWLVFTHTSKPTQNDDSTMSNQTHKIVFAPVPFSPEPQLECHHRPRILLSDRTADGGSIATARLR